MHPDGESPGGLIAQTLREEILSGRRVGGERLVEESIAKAFGVSRVPVREALAQLQAEGFVTIVRYRGATVSTTLHKENKELLEVRHGLEVLRQSHIVCTLTPSITPILLGEWLNAGTHLNVVGAAPRPNEREVDGDAIARSKVVVDSTATALSKSGDALLAIADGAVDETHFAIELGDVITGRKTGRSTDTEITLYDSTGIGLEDLAVAESIIQRARAAEVGTEIDLTS